jgi:membrane protein
VPEPRQAADVPADADPLAGHETVRASWRALAAALKGGDVEDAPPAWIPQWAPPGIGSSTAVAVLRVQGAVTWWNATRGARGLKRFNRRQGGLLCGGLAYTALFSLFAGLAIGYTAFMALLGSHEKLRVSLLDTINSYVPGLIDTGDGGAIKPDQLIVSASSLAGVIAILVLLYSAIAFMGALRRAVRAMFGLSSVPVNYLIGKVRDLAAFGVLLVGVLVSSTVSVVATQSAAWFLRTFDLPAGASALFTAVGLVLAGVVDLMLIFYVVRVLGNVRPPRRDLVIGCVTTAVALGVLRVLGTSAITHSAGSNVLLASFAAIVTVLLLVNFVARVLLMACAWMANPPFEPEHDADTDDPETDD